VDNCPNFFEKSADSPEKMWRKIEEKWLKTVFKQIQGFFAQVIQSYPQVKPDNYLRNYRHIWKSLTRECHIYGHWLYPRFLSTVSTPPTVNTDSYTIKCME